MWILKSLKIKSVNNIAPSVPCLTATSAGQEVQIPSQHNKKLSELLLRENIWCILCSDSVDLHNPLSSSSLFVVSSPVNH